MDNKDVTGNNPHNDQSADPTQALQEQVGDLEASGQAERSEDQAAQPGDVTDAGGQEQTAQRIEDTTSLVRYGRMNMLGEFSRPKNGHLAVGTKVVVRSERGIEIGRIVLGYCEGCGDRGISRQRWQEYLQRCGQDYPISYKGRILRVASDQDLTDQVRLNQKAPEKLAFCQKQVGQMGLNMKLVEVEHLFGGDRILFYFKSEKRVDFRGLVRRLAKEYQTRIEMRQVGARDEARLLADFERCGRECCCRSFLKLLAPVNMRMAKVQKATLDPAKISGRCGRLMCCLRYEQDTYDDLRKKLPARNTRVITPEGEALVSDRQILTQLVMVRFPDTRRMAFPLSEITVLSGKDGQGGEPNRKKTDQNDSANQANCSAEPDQAGDDRSNQARRRRKRKRGKSKRPRVE